MMLNELQAMSNYPPWWVKDSKPNAQHKAKKTNSESNAGMPLATLKAVLSTTSSRDEKKEFNERDPSNRHQYLQQPDRTYTHPRLNVFGRDIGPMGKPPPTFTGGWGIGKKRK